MSLTRIINKSRPHTNVPWFSFSSEYKQVLTEQGITFSSEELDSLSIRTTLVFPSSEAKAAWESNPIVTQELENLRKYTQFANITVDATEV